MKKLIVAGLMVAGVFALTACGGNTPEPGAKCQSAVKCDSGKAGKCGSVKEAATKCAGGKCGK